MFVMFTFMFTLVLTRWMEKITGYNERYERVRRSNKRLLTFIQDETINARPRNNKGRQRFISGEKRRSYRFREAVL